jgi:hypothetical protein
LARTDVHTPVKYLPEFANVFDVWYLASKHFARRDGDVNDSDRRELLTRAQSKRVAMREIISQLEG